MALMFAHSYSAWHVQLLLDQMKEDAIKGEFGLLEIMHHYTAGMKSVFTQECYDSLILIR